MLSDSFLKGLLAAHHDTEGSIRDAWTAAGFREACEVGPCCCAQMTHLRVEPLNRDRCFYGTRMW